MKSLRLNEEFLLENSVGVVDLEEEDFQRLGFQRTKAVSYRYDGEGNVQRWEGEAVRDEELESLVGVENYRVAKHLVKRLVKDINLSTMEQLGNSRNQKTQNRYKKSKNRKRKSRKKKISVEVQFPWGREHKYTCGTWIKSEHCGYEYWVKTICRREDCPNCGKQNSLYHRELYLSMLGVVLKMFRKAGFIGYLVITSTPELREKWKNPKELSKFREYIRRLLKREGFPVAIFRWHFAGDKSDRYYPHLNILLPLGFMPKKKLERLKKLIERKTGIKVVNYRYTRDIGKIKHWVRYISRPTFLNQNEVSYERFKRFKKWGVWGAEELGIVGEKRGINKEEVEEFWMALGTLFFILAQKNVESEGVGNIDDLVKRFLELVGKDSGEDMERVVKEASVGGGGLKGKVRRILEKVLEIKGYPKLEELAGFIVRKGRCIACFQKLKWKWGGRKGPLITSKDRVYKLGWGVWVIVNSEEEYEEEFPF
jgi:hypothetical protein